ncbi:hypothetical protein A0J48_014920 [Sphaerospermopsis aphanizomenoides BCCUSP55]|uniref:hypothetical protein n=1 Tax=Sphaerospermopsis aphanizomenoides TaxID=459663 RepID=UPI0019030B0A|nr:hypothetical protein [Sphaerospermopsis aphanizomenoides]MBK1988813.1 hypothetical protein [Sphaerospermopsis aphanizomenoides BCCUSP55]
MANIQVSTLLPVGYELFDDSASFLNELANQEIQTVMGGGHSCHSHRYHHSHKGYSHKDYSNQSYGGGWW